MLNWLLRLWHKFGAWLVQSSAAPAHHAPVSETYHPSNLPPVVVRIASEGPSESGKRVMFIAAGLRRAAVPARAFPGASAFDGMSGADAAIRRQGFERTVTFAMDDDAAVIAERVRETMEE